MTDTLMMSERSVDTALRVVPQTPAIGAEVSGINLRGPLSAEQVATIRKLMLTHKVLFFRDQHLDTAQQLAFARCFGSVVHFPSVRSTHPDHPGVHVVSGRPPRRPDNDRDSGVWHIDASSLVAVPFATVLRAVTIPPVGGDTVFADLTAAYAGLPDELRRIVDDLYLTHHAPGPARAHDSDQPLVSRPLVRTHPETRQKILYISFLLQPSVIGWPPERSAELIRTLKEEATRPEYQVRFSWSAGAVVLWDNRAVHHYGVTDYGDAPRRLERVLIAAPDLPIVERLI